MSKQKQSNLTSFWQHEHEVLATQFGAWFFTMAVCLGMLELAHQQVAISEQSQPHPSSSEITARGEGAKETARMPEEYDIGLRAPAVSGF